MNRTIAGVAFAAFALTGVASTSPAGAAGAGAAVRRAAPTVRLAALPTVRGAERSATPEQRPSRREPRCTFGIFPAASSRCIA
jgi:hypothetical protein